MSDSKDLWGDAILDKLVQDRATATLEAMWRTSDPGLAGRLVARFAASTNTRLGDLLADEVLRARLGESFANELLDALADRRPKLTQPRSRELSDAFRAEELPATYRNHPAVGMWVLEQPGAAGDSLTLEVLTGESSLAGDDGVRASAVQRCRSRPALLKRAAAHFLSTLEDPVEAGDWEEVAEFVEYACRNESEVPPPVRPIVDRLIEVAPDAATVSEFDERLAWAVTQTGMPGLKKALTTRQLPSTSGSQALASVVDDVANRRERASLFARLLEHQPHLWSLAAAPDWVDDEWRTRLTAVAASKKPIDRRVLEQLFTWSPVAVSSLLTRIAVTQATADNDHVLDLASSNLRQVLDALPEGESGVNTIWWPKEPGRQEYLKEILARTLHDEDNGVLIAAAYRSKELTADDAASLLPPGGVQSALSSLEPGRRRRDLCEAIAEEHPAAVAEAVSALQAELFAPDLAEGIGSDDPDAAFSGAGAVLEHGGEEDKNRLVELLERFGASGQLPLLDQTAIDTDRRNSERRLRAAKVIAGLVGPGTPLPASTVGLLESGKPALRAAGADIIGAAEPHDLEIVRKLRNVGGTRGEGGVAAEKALDRLAGRLAKELEGTDEPGALVDLLALLGAVGRPQVVSGLLEFCGEEARNDDLRVRRQAAEALSEACLALKEVTPDEHAALVDLLEGDRREDDAEAQESLQAALARISLGEDAALQILYDTIGRVPKGSPDNLFGAEKAALVRHLGLYERARKRGESGLGEAIAQLDLVAERLERAAFLQCDDASTKIKEQIRSDPRAPDHGALIQACAGVKKLNKAQPSMGVLHQLRSERTEITHAGSTPSVDDLTRAQGCFKDVATVCVGIVESSRT